MTGAGTLSSVGTPTEAIIARMTRDPDIRHGVTSDSNVLFGYKVILLTKGLRMLCSNYKLQNAGVTSFAWRGQTILLS